KETRCSPSRGQHKFIRLVTYLMQDLPFPLPEILLSLLGKNLRNRPSLSALDTLVQIQKRKSFIFGQFLPERGLATRHISHDKVLHPFHFRHLFEIQLHLRLVTQHIRVRDLEINVGRSRFLAFLLTAIQRFDLVDLFYLVSRHPLSASLVRFLGNKLICNNHLNRTTSVTSTKHNLEPSSICTSQR